MNQNDIVCLPCLPDFKLGSVNICLVVKCCQMPQKCSAIGNPVARFPGGHPVPEVWSSGLSPHTDLDSLVQVRKTSGSPTPPHPQLLCGTGVDSGVLSC